MRHPLPTGPAPPRKGQAGPRRGSDVSQCSDRGRAIEDCAKIAERYAGRMALAPSALARDIAVDIRKLATAPPMPGGIDRRDFPWWAFI